MQWIAVLVFCIACGAKSGLTGVALDASVDARRADAAVDGSVDALMDVRPDTQFDAGDDPDRPPRPCRERPQPVDVLLVLDSSGSMLHDIPAIAVEIPRLLRDLVEPPDLDGDGVADWAAIDDFHYAVALTADDGEFNRSGDRERDECAGVTYEPWQSYQRGDSIGPVLRDASCVTAHSGLGREDLLSVALQSLLPPWSSFPYRQSPDLYEEQAGFLREDSVLVVLFMTDEDDDSECTELPTDRCIERCAMRGDASICEPALGSVAELKRGFAELGSRDIVVAGVMGVESDLPAVPEAPGCESEDREAEPAPRMADFVSSHDGLFFSICQRDYRRVAREVAGRVGVLACDE